MRKNFKIVAALIARLSPATAAKAQVTYYDAYTLPPENGYYESYAIDPSWKDVLADSLPSNPFNDHVCGRDDIAALVVYNFRRPDRDSYIENIPAYCQRSAAEKTKVEQAIADLGKVRSSLSDRTEADYQKTLTVIDRQAVELFKPASASLKASIDRRQAA